ncbi:MAG: VCBS repeat-containing protein [Anaerolineales bacterium]|nr:VCBS repeat-containing protein [Anaerolineales bacterium]
MWARGAGAALLLALLLAGCGLDFDRVRTQDIALADLDGDGDLDAVLANGTGEGVAPDTVCWNDGTGSFADSGQRLGPYDTRNVLAADFDGDGDPDVMLNLGLGAWVLPNPGSGRLGAVPTSGRLDFDRLTFHDLAAGDLDGDGDLDLVLAGCCGIVEFGNNFTNWYPPESVVALSDGQGRFSDSGQRLGELGSMAVALGDVDGDGDLDIFLGNATSVRDTHGTTRRDEPNTVWLNDGHGRFADSGQRLGRAETYAVALGDVDSDGDLDAWAGNRGADEVWLNGGTGRFVDSGQALGSGQTRFAALADLDGDGDLDALAAGAEAATAWRNDGAGRFTAHRPALNYADDCAVALGDVNGDGAPDVVAGCLEREVRAWLNDGAGGFEAR